MIQSTDNTPTKGELTRQTLIESAHKLFLQKGYHGTSMRHIAKRAGLALGGIYNHFASKEEIFQAVILAHHPFLKIFPKFEEATITDITSAEELIRTVTHLIFAEFEKEPQLLNLIFIEMIELNGKNLASLFSVLQPMVFTFIQRIAVLKPDWRIPSPIVFLRSYIGLIVGVYLTDRFLDKTLSVDGEMGTLDEYLEIYFHGLFKS
ncbi:MAG: AcrR family transcriptional regulator [Cellvibrionaceae bacterium]|jgi:AcrR family transcriptional regulator